MPSIVPDPSWLELLLFFLIPVIPAFALPVDVSRSMVVREVTTSPFCEAFNC